MNLTRKLWIKVKDIQTAQLVIDTLLNEYLEKDLIESYGTFDKSVNGDFDFLDERSFYLTFDENFDYFSLCKKISIVFNTKMLCWLAGDFFYFSDDHDFSNDKDPFENEYKYDAIDKFESIENIFKDNSAEMSEGVNEWISNLESNFLNDLKDSKIFDKNEKNEDHSWDEIISTYFDESSSEESCDKCECLDNFSCCSNFKDDNEIVCECNPCSCTVENNCGCNMFLEKEKTCLSESLDKCSCNDSEQKDNEQNFCNCELNEDCINNECCCESDSIEPKNELEWSFDFSSNEEENEDDTCDDCCCESDSNESKDDELVWSNDFSSNEDDTCDDCCCDSSSDENNQDDECCLECNCDNSETVEFGKESYVSCETEDCNDCSGCSWDIDENFDHNEVLKFKTDEEDEKFENNYSENEDLSHHYKCVCEDAVNDNKESDFIDNESIIEIDSMSVNDDKINKIDAIENIFESNSINSVDLEENKDDILFSDQKLNLDDVIDVFASDVINNDVESDDLIPADEFLKLIEENEKVDFESIDEKEKYFSIDSEFNQNTEEEFVNFEDFFAKITQDQMPDKESHDDTFEKFSEKANYKDWSIELIDADGLEIKNSPKFENNNVLNSDETFDIESNDDSFIDFNAQIEIIDNNDNNELSDFEKEIKDFFSTNNDIKKEVNNFESPTVEEIESFDFGNFTNELNENQSFIVDEFKPQISQMSSFTEIDQENKDEEIKMESNPTIETSFTFEPDISKEKVQVDKKITNDLQKFLEELRFEKEKLRKRKENLERKTNKVISMFQQLNSSNGFSNN